jgi:hypothetical protein
MPDGILITAPSSTRKLNTLRRAEVCLGGAPESDHTTVAKLGVGITDRRRMSGAKTERPPGGGGSSGERGVTAEHVMTASLR